MPYVDRNDVSNILILTAEEVGADAYEALNACNQRIVDVISLIDDVAKKNTKKGNGMHGMPLLEVTQKYVDAHCIQELILTTKNCIPSRLLEIIHHFSAFDILLSIAPSLAKFIRTRLSLSRLKTMNIESLLDRDPIALNSPSIAIDLTGKVIFVTGAAGSIGSEISKQLGCYDVKELVLIDQSESSLYELHQELKANKITNISPVIADVRDFASMQVLFKRYVPDFVFHAAGYKHVPLMEVFPFEAVKINIFGTKHIADLSLKYGVKRFVMISTDKAVNPTNIMGVTKRIAELYISSLSNACDSTIFTTTRFGNVLESNGSVIPLFKKQIEKGGPVTVTHQEVTRYFMTIPEACGLVLEAATMGQGDETYIFDMGTPVKIMDLAKKMIAASGLKFPTDIDIQFTGLRPGEKLHEELLADAEHTIPTQNDNILIVKSENNPPRYLASNLEQLSTFKEGDAINTLVEILKKIVPEFKPNNL